MKLFGLSFYLLAVAVTSTVSEKAPLDCHGITEQGGMVVCQTNPNARVEVGRAEDDVYPMYADENGVIIIGFDRDEPAAFARTSTHRVNFDIRKRDYDISRIDGLPRNMVSEYTEEELARIRSASARKKTRASSATTCRRGSSACRSARRIPSVGSKRSTRPRKT